MRAQIRHGLSLALAFTVFGHWAIAQAPPAPSSLAQQEESARERWQKVPEIFEAMAVRPGANVADVPVTPAGRSVRRAVTMPVTSLPRTRSMVRFVVPPR